MLGIDVVHVVEAERHRRVLARFAAPGRAIPEAVHAPAAAGAHASRELFEGEQREERRAGEGVHVEIGEALVLGFGALTRPFAPGAHVGDIVCLQERMPVEAFGECTLHTAPGFQVLGRVVVGNRDLHSGPGDHPPTGLVPLYVPVRQRRLRATAEGHEPHRQCLAALGADFEGLLDHGEVVPSGIRLQDLPEPAAVGDCARQIPGDHSAGRTRHPAASYTPISVLSYSSLYFLRRSR